MHKPLQTVLLASALSVCVAAPAWSAGLLDSIESQATQTLGGTAASSHSSSSLGALGSTGGLGSALGLPSISSGTASNAAGVLQYCVQNKVLGGASASSATSVKNGLLSKLGMASPQQQQQNAGYQQGLEGVLSGSGGSSFDLGKLKSSLKEKACSYVLEHASSLL